jgi:hypothetical protein
MASRMTPTGETQMTEYQIQTPMNSLIWVEAASRRDALIEAANATRATKLPSTSKASHDGKMMTLAGFRHFDAPGHTR